MSTKQNPRTAFMTVSDVAAVVHKCDKTVRRWIKAGKLPAYQLDGSYIIHPKDFELFLRQRWTGQHTMSSSVQ